MSDQLELVGEHTVLETSTGPVSALQLHTGGAPALLVPGYTGSKEDFAPLLTPLAEAGFAVTAIDLPGQFESPGPADPDQYTPDRLAPVVAEISAMLGLHVHLLGHSYGGLVARATVIARPEAFTSLVLMCSGPGAIPGERRDLVEDLEPVLVASGMAAVFAARQAAARANKGWVAPRAPLAAFLERRFIAGVPAMLLGMGKALRAEPDRVAELAAVAPATLVLYGEDDDAWPPALQEEMATRLGAERVVIDSAAHSPAVENPADTAAALIRFWQAHTAASSPAQGS